jgi:hypothetical protein
MQQENNMLTFSILYTGQLYKQQNVGRLFQAIRELIDENRVPVDAFMVDFYGTQPLFLTEPMKKFGVEKNVTIHDRIPHAECLHLQQEADVLLVIDWDDFSCDPGCGTKFYEYLPSSRPILAIGCKETCAIRDVLNETHRDVYCKSVEEIKRVLKRWWDEEYGYDYRVSRGLT